MSKEGSLVDAGVKYGLIAKAGSWYNYGEKKIGQGRENAKDFLLQNPDIAMLIETKIRAALLPVDDKVEVTETPKKKKADNPDQKELEI